METDHRKNSYPTIKDIAKLSNVGIATVSRVINNSGKVSESTKKRVLEVIEETGYSPNLNARSLSSKKSYSLSYVVPDMGNSFYGIIYSSLESTLIKSNYRTIVFPLINDFDLQKIKQKTDLIYQTDGVFLTSLSVSKIFRSKIPHKKIILIDTADSRFDSVYIDNYKVGQMAGEYLLKNSRPDSLFYLVTFKELENEFTSNVFSKRDKGFTDFMKSHGKNVKITYADLMWNGGYEAMKKSLKRKTGNYISVFSACDMLGLGVKMFMDKKGLVPKKDYSLISVDDLPQGEMSGLSTIKQPIENFGKIATEMFISYSEGRKNLIHKELKCKLIERET